MSMVFIALLIDYGYIKTFGNVFGSFFQFVDNDVIGKDFASILNANNKMIIQCIYRMRTFIKNIFHKSIIANTFRLSSKINSQFIPNLSEIGLGTSW